MMKWYYVLGIVVVLIIGTGSIYSFQKSKIAYVRSHDLIYAYDGTKEAMTAFNDKKSQWQANVDTLRTSFQRAVDMYNKEYPKLSLQEKQLRETGLQRQQQQWESYALAIEQKIEEEDDKMMQAILNQVNSSIKAYGEQNGYDVILGTTTSGSVLYGRESMDITDELIKVLNRQYQGE
ncbi:MAG: OmpH family outer membrane protein [Bacteroidota bacterium]